tara:strand:+ start:2138 stop:2713 length:576 start_codon:yes stop_codon:yes gene_type:complete
MADTGIRSPQTVTGVSTNASNTIDGDDSSFGYSIHFSTAAITSVFSNFAGSDIPSGATINGVKVTVRAQYYNFYAATKLANVKVSLDGASGTFSSAAASQNLTSTVADYNFGGASELWGLDWSSWTDISDLAVSLQSDQQSDSATTAITFLYEVEATVYYSTPAAGDKTAPGVLRLKGGNVKLKGGNLIIK